MSAYINPLSGLSGAVVKHIKHPDELVKDIALELVDLMKENLSLIDKDYTGAAIKSIEYDEVDKKVGSSLDYVRNIEFGRKKGNRPPVDKLESWVQGKLGIHAPQSREVAEKIASSIAEHGIPETRFTQQALIEMTGGIKKLRKPRRKLTRSEKWLKKMKKLSKKAKKISKKTYKISKKVGKKAIKTQKFIHKQANKKGGFGKL